MKKYLNTLFITTQGAYLSKEGETVVVSVEKEVKLQVPIHTLGGIVCFGNVMYSPFLLGFYAKNNVGISFLTEYGNFLARVHGKTSGNVLLRREHYRKADDMSFSAEIARAILIGKILNSRTVLERALRDHSDKVNSDQINSASLSLKSSLKWLARPGGLEKKFDLDTLRGIEGDAAHNYFNFFDHLIVAQKSDFIFKDRNRRPPLDEVNCLLSFLYTLVMHDTRSALESVGLKPKRTTNYDEYQDCRAPRGRVD